MLIVIGLIAAGQAQAGLPGVWMVRPTEMNKNGRRDLVNAIQRTGGYEAAVERLG